MHYHDMVTHDVQYGSAEDRHQSREPESLDSGNGSLCGDSTMSSGSTEIIPRSAERITNSPSTPYRVQVPHKGRTCFY